MTTTLILYVLLPIIGTVMLFMAMDKRMKAGDIIRMFWNAFKGVPPVREEDRVVMLPPAIHPWDILDQYSNKTFEYEKVDWKKEGF